MSDHLSSTPSLTLLHLYISHIHTVSGLLQVGVQELSSCLVEEVTVTRGTALSVIRFPDVHSEDHSLYETLHSSIEGSQIYTQHTYPQGKKSFVTELWSRQTIVEMHWPRPYMVACLDGL